MESVDIYAVNLKRFLKMVHARNAQTIQDHRSTVKAVNHSVVVMIVQLTTRNWDLKRMEHVLCSVLKIKRVKLTSLVELIKGLLMIQNSKSSTKLTQCHPKMKN